MADLGRPQSLAARNLTITDVENALRSENIELPRVTVNPKQADFRVRIQRAIEPVADFENLVLPRSADGYWSGADVARVETGPASAATCCGGNGVRWWHRNRQQSKANTLAVAKLAKAQPPRS